jgi:hypothetical protein
MVTSRDNKKEMAAMMEKVFLVKLSRLSHTTGR